MPKEFDRMVEAIKRKLGNRGNPYAIARSKLGTDAQILARRQRKSKKKNRSRMKS